MANMTNSAEKRATALRKALLYKVASYKRDVMETIEDQVYSSYYTELDEDALTNTAYISELVKVYLMTDDLYLAFETVDYAEYREEVA